jgi:hypothetical protein
MNEWAKFRTGRNCNVGITENKCLHRFESYLVN